GPGRRRLLVQLRRQRQPGRQRQPQHRAVCLGRLIATYHAGDPTSILNAVQVGDIIQYQNVQMTTVTHSGNTTYTSTSSAPHHSPIVAGDGGNGNLQVLEQNASPTGTPNIIRQDAESFSGMSQGTIWVYRPEAA